MSEVNWEEVRVGVNVFRRYDPGGPGGGGVSSTLLMSEVNWEEVWVGVNVFRRCDTGGPWGGGVRE
ncbi:unnamed protein product [Prunus armeniaca]